MSESYTVIGGSFSLREAEMVVGSIREIISSGTYVEMTSNKIAQTEVLPREIQVRQLALLRRVESEMLLSSDESDLVRTRIESIECWVDNADD